MNNKIVSALAFVAGAAIGSAVTWKVVKDKYESIIQEEIDSVKEAFKIENKSSVNDKKKEDEPTSYESKKVYEKVVDGLGYGKPSEKKPPVQNNKIYVIPPEAFGECDYETVSLTYYADKVLADDKDKVVENVNELIGLESLNCFGEYEDDSVFVRNDELKIDYEILMDMRNYSDVASKKPSPVDDDE